MMWCVAILSRYCQKPSAGYVPLPRPPLSSPCSLNNSESCHAAAARHRQEPGFYNFKSRFGLLSPFLGGVTSRTARTLFNWAEHKQLLDADRMVAPLPMKYGPALDLGGQHLPKET